MSAADQFAQDYKGKVGVSFDGVPANAGQCVQSVCFYVRDYLHAPVMWADAAYWFINFPGSALDGPFTRIANDPNDSNQVPQNGDIIIWNTNLPNSGGAGHIAVVLSTFPGGFISFDSNWGGKYCHQVSHNWSYVLGWLRPTNSQGGNNVAIIENADNWYGRCNKAHLQIRGRELGRDVFNTFVGQDFLHFIEACSDDPEADTIQHAQEVGQQAIADNWPGQIYGLEDQLKASQTIANQLNEAVVAAQNANQADLQAALAKVADLTAQLQTANDKLKDVQNNVTVDTQTKDNVSAILKIVKAIQGMVANLFKVKKG